LRSAMRLAPVLDTSGVPRQYEAMVFPMQGTCR
jgi:hypothetical protein